MNDRYRDNVSLGKLIVTDPEKKNLGQALGKIADQLQQLRRSETFARSQLRRLVNEMLAARDSKAAALLAGGKSSESAKAKFPPSHFRNAKSEDIAALKELEVLFGSDATALWLQIEELWEYALPTLKTSQSPNPIEA